MGSVERWSAGGKKKGLSGHVIQAQRANISQCELSKLYCQDDDQCVESGFPRNVRLSHGYDARLQASR